MSETKTIPTLTRAEQKELIRTMNQALKICDYTGDDKTRLERDICEKFKVRHVYEIKAKDLIEVETWILSVWPNIDLKRRLMRTSKEHCEILLQVDRQIQMTSVQFG